MKILLAEFLTGGGAYAWGTRPEGTLRDEGRAMVEALAVDWSRVDGADVTLAWDVRLPWNESLNVRRWNVTGGEQERELFRRAGDFDGVVIVAPEIDDALGERTRWAEDAGARLLCPDSRVVALGSDKRATERLFLRREGDDGRVRMVPSLLREEFGHGNESPSGEWVIKPVDGAGCDRIVRMSDLDRAFSANPDDVFDRYLIQPYIAGTPASVAMIGGARPIMLPPCGQTLTWHDGRPSYGGGETIADPRQFGLARAAAAFVIERLGPFVGYVGVDLILAGDVAWIVEVNPRVSTSYVGLRVAIDENPAELILSAANGETPPDPPLRRHVRYDTVGRTTIFGR